MSTISEWMLGISFLVYFMTFHNEFNQVLITVKVGRRDYMTAHEDMGPGSLDEERPLAL